MMTALNTLNELMQGECCTMIDFAKYALSKNKKFASFPILDRFIEDLDLKPNLMTLILFVILEHLHTLRKNFKKYITESINCVWIKNHSPQMWPMLM